MQPDPNPLFAKGNFQQISHPDEILDLISVACYESDSDNNFIYVNRKAEDLAARKKKDLLGRNIWEIFPQFLSAEYFAIVNDAIKNKRYLTFKYFSDIKHTRVSLSIKPTQFGAIFLFTELEEVNITKLQLEEEQRRRKLVETTGHIGYFEYYLDSDDVYWSNEMYRIYGIEPQTEQITFEKFIKYVHPKDRENCRQQLQDAINNQQPYQSFFRILTSTGQVRSVVWHGGFLMNKNGRNNRIYGTIQDITEHEKTKDGLKGSIELLQSVFDTSLMGMSVLKAVRDEAGAVKDFSIRIINKEFERQTNRINMVGKLYAVEYPDIKKNGLYDLMLKVMETGAPGEMEYSYRYDSYGKWFHTMFVKMDDCLVATNLDITVRKQVEHEKFKNLTLLQQSEEIAQMGSWEYDVLTKALIWSNGMYRLFGLKEGIKVKPEIYLQYATELSKPAAERIVNSLKTATAFEEAIEILTPDGIKILKLKATVVCNEDDSPIRVIGADMDITVEVKLQQEKNLLENQRIIMEATQNQKIFQATLNSQEEERKRIAESLHNGLGQLLYGVKLSLEQLNFNARHIDIIALNNTKQKTNQLLTETIKESRRISHELTPTILEDFGLKVAITDICSQFSPTVPMKCDFIGLNQRLSKYIEITIYRAAQELVMNIIKHAQATRASIKLVVKQGVVILTVQDNGISFSDKGKGIGLKTIQNKVKLLNGNFSRTSGRGKGNMIRISIPYEHVQTN